MTIVCKASYKGGISTSQEAGIERIKAYIPTWHALLVVWKNNLRPSLARELNVVRAIPVYEFRGIRTF